MASFKWGEKLELNRMSSLWDRTNRNNINANWQTIEDTLSFIEDGDFAPNSIGATQLKNASVGTSQLANGAVNQSKLASDSVGAGQLRDYAVGSRSITSDAVTNVKVRPQSLNLDRLDTDVHVVRKPEEILVLVPSKKNYLGYSIKRKTIPYQDGVSGSNLDLWSLDRVSVYNRDGNDFTENNALVWIYTPESFSTPMTTQDTVFRIAGDSDYSGGNQHGDEKIITFDVIAGNARLTGDNFSRSGERFTLVQETHLFPDSRTHGADTQPFAKVRKTHTFDVKNGYRLKHKVEFLSDVTLDFATVGALQMRRKYANGGSNNITNVVALDNAKHYNVSSPDSESNHLVGEKEREYMIIGYHKEMRLKLTSDHPEAEIYFRNYAPGDVKFYATLFPTGTSVTAGESYITELQYDFVNLS